MPSRKQARAAISTVFDRRDEFARDRAADDLVDEFEAHAALQRLEDDLDFGVLAGTTGLLLMRIDMLVLARDRLAIGDLRPAGRDSDAQLVDRGREMQLAHAAQNRLPRVLVDFQAQRRVGADHLA